MIRSHLLYEGDIESAVTKQRESFESLDLEISLIFDQDPDNESEWDFYVSNMPSFKHISEYKFMGTTDGRRFNLGALFESESYFLEEDLEDLETKAERMFDRFKAAGWDVKVERKMFTKADYKRKLKEVEEKEKKLAKKGTRRTRSEETELYKEIPALKKRLEKSVAEGRYNVKVSVNCDEKGKLQTFVNVPKEVPGILFGKRTVHERKIKAFRFEDVGEMLDKVGEFGDIVASIVGFYHQLLGVTPDADLLLHVKYEEGLNPLKKPLAEFRRGNRSTFGFNVNPEKVKVSYNTLAEYCKSQQAIVMPVGKKPKPIKVELPKPKTEQKEANGKETPLHEKLNITKKKIKDALGAYVVGQEEAKDVLAAAAYKHYARIYQSANDAVKIEKSNVLFYGPTGCGKTHLLESLAKILDVPLIIADATNLTAPGYVGEDASEMVERIVTQANGDRERAQMGIIYIDEIDKLASLGDRASVKTTQVQFNLLKLIEGKVVKTKYGPVDTSNILFICGGAFAGDQSSDIPGLEELAKERLSPEEKRRIGFGKESQEDGKPDIDYHRLMQYITPGDLHVYGIAPELIGRLKARAGLNRLTRDELRNIITEPVNSPLKQAKKLFSQEGIELEFEEAAVDYVADVAYRHNTGARAIESAIHRITDALLDKIGGEDKKIVVTKDMAEQYLAKL